MASEMRDHLMSFIQADPQTNMVQTLDAIKEARGEVRRVLMNCIEHDLFGALDHAQAVLLNMVIMTQGQNYMGAMTPDDSVADKEKEAFRIKRLFVDAVMQAQTALPAIGYRTQINESNETGLTLQLGVTYGGYKLEQAGNVYGLKAPKPVRA
jgi:hypothetical protein